MGFLLAIIDIVFSAFATWWVRDIYKEDDPTGMKLASRLAAEKAQRDSKNEKS